MPKDLNPPNAPELRPIEKYWTIMKQALWKHPKKVKSEDDMKKKMDLHAKKCGLKRCTRAYE